MDWTAVGAIATSIASIVALALAFPQTHHFLNRPKITLTLKGPSQDNGEYYWHIVIKNTGGELKNAALFVVGYKNINGVDVLIPPLRTLWSYEAVNGLGVTRHIVSSQYSDFFIFRRPDNYNEPVQGLCLAGQPTRIELPFSSGQSIAIAVQLIGENYASKEKWLRITKIKEEPNWQVTEI